MAVKFGKVENNNETSSSTYASAMQMGIEHAPSKLIVKYITDMYVHPLSAAIRETVSNALDAVYAAGKDANAVKVSYDNELFCVRDAGEGMTYDKLVNVYTQYGVSDKRDDGISTGAFGLGAKSPLAYTKEFFVLTKTKEDGCLFLRAYRTVDDDFIADLPIHVDGKMEVNTYHTITGDCLVPVIDESGNEILSDGAISRTLQIDDPFGDDETGTIVSFKTEHDWSTHQKVNSLIESMSTLLHYCGDGDIIDDGKFLEQGYFCFGEKSIEDDDDNSLSLRVFACHTLTSFFSAYRMQHFACLFNGDDIPNDRMMFKVGNWLYPVDGSKTYMEDVPAFIIDIPSKALSFVPSRDAIRIGTNDNVEALVQAAKDVIVDFFTKPDTREQFLNWATSLTNNLVSSASVLFSGTRVQESITGHEIHLQNKNGESMTLDMNSLEAVNGYTLDELIDTPYCVCGIVDTPKKDLRNAGVYAPSNCDASRIFGNASVNIMNADGSICLHRTGYNLMKSKSIADGVYGQIGDTIAHTPEDLIYSNTYLNRKIIDVEDDRSFGSFDYPIGVALMNLTSYRAQHSSNSSHILFIDANQIGVKKARTSVLNIAKNLQNAAREAEESIPTSYLYVILPPKNTTSAYSDSEIVAIEKKISSIACACGTGYTYVGNDDIEKMSKKPAANVIQSSELEKMVSNARVVYHVTELDDEGVLVKDKLEGSSYKRIDKKLLAKMMLDNPSAWGIVAVHGSPERAWELARALYALELVPEYIERIVCISDKNISAKRGTLCVESGFLVLYDQNNKSGEGFLSPSIASFTESGNVILHVQPTHIARSVQARDRYQMLNRRFLDIINSGIANNSWYPKKKMLLNWVEGFTCGHEKIDFDEDFSMLDDVAEWKKSVISNIKIVSDEKEPVAAGLMLNDAELERMYVKLHQCVNIWQFCLRSMALTLDLDLLSEKTPSILTQLASVTGAAACIDSLYAGVPYEDIIA